MTESIIIAISFDKQYAEQATVMLYSLLSTNSEQSFKIFVFYNDLDNQTKVLIKANLSTFSNYEIHWTRIDESLIKSFNHRKGHVNEYTYSRIYVCQFLHQYKRLIYLDCDLLVLQDIAEFWNTDLKGNTIAAVCDPSTRFHEIGVAVGENYFNAGVLLIDVERWNNKRYSERLSEKLIELGEKAWERDQDALNLILEKDTLRIDKKWNTQSHHVAVEQEAGRKNIRGYLAPSIIHFTGNLKPWNFKSSNPFKMDYYQYLAKTSFKNSHKPENRTFINIIRKKARSVFVTLRLLKY